MMKIFEKFFQPRQQNVAINGSNEKLKLNHIQDILFPPLERDNQLNENGKIVVGYIDRSIDSNLEAVLNDIQDGHIDDTCYNTLNSVIKRLIVIRKILNVDYQINEDIEYIKVESLELEKNIEEIS